MLWKGTILVEMKSRGKNLDKAFEQALAYTHGLKTHELPKYILVCDFHVFRLYDTEEQTTLTFTLPELVHNVQHFGYLLGYQKKVYKEQDPVNIKAAELMGNLHDKLKDIGYEGHPLEVYLVRLLFCLFAEVTTIFNKQQFQDFIEYKTREDGSDLAARIQELFQVLNTPNDKRFKNLDEDLNAFPYVNGKLFEEVLPMASFDSKMRQLLLDACVIDWSKISPAIFGSMFQSVMNPKERRNLGAHYTSESNILKLIKPLFLDALWAEFETAKTNRNKLNEFHVKLSQLKFLDPACGCGNFLIITYRELRLLELEILRHQRTNGQGVLDISAIMLLDVDMVYGIEYEEFPARIAEVAMWLIDHQMNMLVSQEFGQYYARLPLKKSANVVHADALALGWEHLVPANQLSYIVGNPPFIGSNIMSQTQRNAIVQEFGDKAGGGVLDYVTGWYLKAAKYIQGTNIQVAFVSTNSIVQGLQTSLLWEPLLNDYNIHIHFAHRTFKWSNEAKGNAAVYCVIIGFATFDIPIKKLFEYEDIKGEAHEIKAKNINPYLIDAKNTFVIRRQKPINNIPSMSVGNMPADGGKLLIETFEEKERLIKQEPRVIPYIKEFIGAHEFLNNKRKWCFWLLDINPSDLRNIPMIKEIVSDIKEIRLKSSRPKLAEIPHLFAQITQNNKCNYILVPRHSSENRKYIPLGFYDYNTIIGDSCLFIEDANLYHFGVLMSEMHMAWVKTTCGRLESRFRYSKDIVYNNYPWPKEPSAAAIQKIEAAAQGVLEARALYPTSSLADLYDPLTMPPALVKAHNTLDKAVDAAYSKQKLDTEAKRMEFLFNLYESYLAEN